MKAWKPTHRFSDALGTQDIMWDGSRFWTEIEWYERSSLEARFDVGGTICRISPPNRDEELIRTKIEEHTRARKP